MLCSEANADQGGQLTRSAFVGVPDRKASRSAWTRGSVCVERLWKSVKCEEASPTATKTLPLPGTRRHAALQSVFIAPLIGGSAMAANDTTAASGRRKEDGILGAKP